MSITATICSSEQTTLTNQYFAPGRIHHIRRSITTATDRIAIIKHSTNGQCLLQAHFATSRQIVAQGKHTGHWPNFAKQQATNNMGWN